MENKTPQIDNSGWISIHRKLLNNPIFDNANALKVWVWCLLKAGFTEKDTYLGLVKIHLEKGQFIFGRHTASVELKMKPSTVWSYMLLLKGDSYLDIKTTNKYSIVTILNWNEYQKNDSKSDNRMTTDRQQNDTNNKDNKENKENRETLKKTSDQADKKKTNRLVNYIISPTLCMVQKSEDGCGKCPYCSLTILSPEQIYNVAKEKKVDYQDVLRTQESLVSWIENGRMKDKTFYRTLKNWINNGIMRGDIRELGFMELEMMDLKYNKKLRAQLDEISGRLERGEIKL